MEAGNRHLYHRSLFAVLILVATMVGLGSCARMGNPDGGWYDDTPPKVLSAEPADGGTNVKGKKITIHFDEFIKIEDATSKVIVSPPQLEVPEIKAEGKNIQVKLLDSLKANTTYTVDFSDAISDNNEGNPMGNYTYSFSTGNEIDTLGVGGYVLDASNLEPIKGILVGLYDDLSDTVFKHKPLMRVSRTDGSGHFMIKGVKPGTYRVYALQDADGNYLYNQKSEMIGFSHATVNPHCGPDIRQDTIWRDELHIDSIRRVPYTHFYPDDVTLLAFQEKLTDRFLLKAERKDEHRLDMVFTYGNPQLPVIRGLNFNSDKAFWVESSPKRDSISYWIRDTALINRDSLSMEVSYLMTDSTGTLFTKTDTIEAVPKLAYERRMKMQAKEYEKWQKEQEKLKKKGDPYDSIMPPVALEPKYNVPGKMNPQSKIYIEMPVPLAKYDTAAIHLYSQIDSVWYRSPYSFRPVAEGSRTYVMAADWRPGTEYSFEIDTLAFTDIYGHTSKPYKTGIKIRDAESYSSLVVNLSGVADTGIVVQLLNGSDKMLREVRAVGGEADFYYLDANTCYLRAFIDRNGNGIWDTGDFEADKQAEDMYYYPKKLEIKENWDMTISWNLTATLRYKQKPMDITKQKPDAKKKLRNRNAERAKEKGITYNNE
jgi:uncharacterized protein (DUF2141 family)